MTVALIGLGLAWISLGVMAITAELNGRHSKADSYGTILLAILFVITWILFA